MKESVQVSVCVACFPVTFSCGEWNGLDNEVLSALSVIMMAFFICSYIHAPQKEDAARYGAWCLDDRPIIATWQSSPPLWIILCACLCHKRTCGDQICETVGLGMGWKTCNLTLEVFISTL
jgi:hypothetical protein